MRRVRYHSHGGPEVLVTEETGIPEPGRGQVLIRTEAIGVNYVDVQLRRETFPGSIYFRSLPATLTGDVVGLVEKVGPETDPALAGTRVAVLLEDAYADYVVADAWLAPPIRTGPARTSPSSSGCSRRVGCASPRRRCRSPRRSRRTGCWRTGPW